MDAAELQIQLGFGFAPQGQLWWDDVSITQIAETPTRLVRVATIHHRARGTKSAQENRDLSMVMAVEVFIWKYAVTFWNR